MLLYFYLLFFCQLFVYTFIIALDCCLKHTNHKLRKANKIMFRYNKEVRTKNQISVGAFWFQIFNYCYVITYIIIALVETYLYRNAVLFYININSVIAYGILALLGDFVMLFLEIFKSNGQKSLESEGAVILKTKIGYSIFMTFLLPFLLVS